MSNHITKKDLEDTISFLKKNDTTMFGGVIMHEHQVDAIRKEMIELAELDEQEKQSDRDVMTEHYHSVLALKARAGKAEAENARLRNIIFQEGQKWENHHDRPEKKKYWADFKALSEVGS